MEGTEFGDKKIFEKVSKANLIILIHLNAVGINE